MSKAKGGNIRGVSEANHARHMIKLFRQSSGDASDYELSEDVQGIDVFLSHSWRAPWRFKILSILWYMHQRDAVIISFAAVAIGVGLTLITPWESVPHWHFTAIDGDRWEYGLTMYLGVVGFLFALRAGNRFKSEGRFFFLDKCCIHQTDITKMQDGIAGLGRLILNPKRLAIFWDRSYFTRLWCVYELAIFLGSGKHTAANVDFSPLFVPKIVLTIFFQAVLSYLALDVFSGLGINDALRSQFPEHDPEATFMVFYILINLVTSGVLMQQLVEFQVDRAEMWQQLQRFSVEDAQLTDENDRPIIYADIEEKWADEDGKHALRNFNEYVRSSVATEVRTVVGTSSSVPYASLLMAFLPHTWRAIDCALGPEPPGRRLHGLLFLSTAACLAYPLAFSLLLRFAHWVAALRQTALRRLLMFIGAVVTGVSIPILVVLWAVVFFFGIPGSSQAYDASVLGSVCLALTLFTTALAVWSVYSERNDHTQSASSSKVKSD